MNDKCDALCYWWNYMHLNHNDTLALQSQKQVLRLKKNKYPGVGNPSPPRGPKNDIQYHSRHGILKYGTKEHEAKNKVPSF